MITRLALYSIRALVFLMFDIADKDYFDCCILNAYFFFIYNPSAILKCLARFNLLISLQHFLGTFLILLEIVLNFCFCYACNFSSSYEVDVKFDVLSCWSIFRRAMSHNGHLDLLFQKFRKESGG